MATGALAVARLVRLPNALLAAAGVALGARWAGAPWTAVSLWLTAAVAMCLTAVANAYNDYDDQAIDAVVHPDRPLPAGDLSPRFALATVALGALAALALSAAVSLPLAGLTAVVIAVMLTYAPLKRRSGVAANAVAAVLGSLPFLYGAWAAGRPAMGWPLVAVAVPLHLAREVAKDIDDRDGDRGLRSTLPLAMGAGAARAVAIVATIVFGAMWVPVAGAVYGLPAMVLAAIGVICITRRARGAALAYKAAMAVAVLTLLLAASTRPA